MGFPQLQVSQPTYLSTGSSYIWSLSSACSRVLHTRAAACSPISASKFVLDTNYSFTVSRAVGWTNERPQSPRHRSLFCNSDRCGGRGRETMDPLLAAGLKVASSKGEGRSRGWKESSGVSIQRGFLFVFIEGCGKLR